MPDEKMSEIIEAFGVYMELRKENFFDYGFLSLQWWILIVIMVGLWVLWFILVDKKDLFPILFVGILSSAIALILDDIGMSLMLWEYPYQIAYFTTRLDPVDVAIIPVSYMLLYQYVKSWKVYTSILVFLGLFGALIAEPIFVKLNLYMILGWNFWYSLPFYIAIGIFVKWLADKLRKNVQQVHRQ